MLMMEIRESADLWFRSGRQGLTEGSNKEEEVVNLAHPGRTWKVTRDEDS